MLKKSRLHNPVQSDNLKEETKMPRTTVTINIKTDDPKLEELLKRAGFKDGGEYIYKEEIQQHGSVMARKILAALGEGESE